MVLFSAPSTLQPGFQDPVFESQETFRLLLNALSFPGRCCELESKVVPPEGLYRSTAAISLCLLDLEVTLWLDPVFGAEVIQWITFHTGCRLVENPQDAQFAILSEFFQPSQNVPNLDSFNPGTVEYPEASTTLLLQIPALRGGASVCLSGCGILQERHISPLVDVGLWKLWGNSDRFPLGMDVYLMTETTIMGLPRSIRVEVL